MFLRYSEVRLLRNIYEDKKAHLVIIYGRRRLGKTTLVLESLKGIKGVYLYTISSDITNIIKYYIESLKKQINVKIIGDINTFKAFLELLIDVAGSDNFVIVFDEFQRLHKADKSAISILQDYWDRLLRFTKIKIIIVGSIVGLIEKIALTGDSPLFGRKTYEIKVTPLPFYRVRKFWSRLNEKEKVIVYGVFGGTPAYIDSYNFNKSIWENIKDLVIDKNARFNREPEEILSEELRNISVYSTILKRIAEGRRGMPLSKIKVGGVNVIPYIRTLEKMDIIERKFPLGVRQRGALYVFKDEFFRFWYRFIAENYWLIEMERYEEVIENIKQEINDYLSYTVEKILKELVTLYSGKILEGIELPKIQKVGSYWEKEIEVDLLALGKNTIIVGEVKWKDQQTTIRDLSKTLEKAEELKEKFKRREYIVIYLSKEGYKKDYREGNIILLTPQTMGKAFDNLTKNFN